MIRPQNKEPILEHMIIEAKEQFVAKWWQKEEREIPRPWGVHAARQTSGRRWVPQESFPWPRPFPRDSCDFAAIIVRKTTYPDTPWDCHICLHWGGLGGQCRDIWHTWSFWDIYIYILCIYTYMTSIIVSYEPPFQSAFLVASAHRREGKVLGI